MLILCAVLLVESEQLQAAHRCADAIQTQVVGDEVWDLQWEPLVKLYARLGREHRGSADSNVDIESCRDWIHEILGQLS